MKLTVLGSNGTYPTPGRPASGYLVSSGGSSVLLDCGPGVFPALLDLGTMPDAIVLSHRHGDHCLDVLPLFNHLRFDRLDVRDLPLYAPRGVYGRLAEFAGAGPNHPFHDVFSQTPVEPGDEVTVGVLRLRFGAAVHPVPAVVVSVNDGDTTLVYSGDTGPGGDLVAVAEHADLLLCEATHQGEVPGERYEYHLYACEAGEVAAEAGVGRLLVTHVAPTLDPAVSITEAASEFDGPVDHATPGMEVEV
jgi:ribonuclease BN (tRNA processing enzyme)